MSDSQWLCSSIHDTTGFTHFHLVFGRTPNLPVDLMLGRFDQDEIPEYPDFVQDLHGKLKESFSIAGCLILMHDRKKPMITGAMELI